MKTPTVRELSTLIRHLKTQILDEYIQEGDTLPSITLTIGVSPDGYWGWQSGDNSYSGAAYPHPFWGVVDVYRRSDSRELARDLIEQVLDAVEYADAA